MSRPCIGKFNTCTNPATISVVLNATDKDPVVEILWFCEQCAEENLEKVNHAV